MKKKFFLFQLFLLLIIISVVGANCDAKGLLKLNSNKANMGDLQYFEEIESGVNSGLTETKNYTIKNETELKSIWKKINKNQIAPTSMPSVDFNNDMLIIAAAGQKNSGSYVISISEIREYNERILVTIITNDGTNIQNNIATQPYCVVKLEKTDKPVMFITNEPETSLTNKPETIISD